MAQAELAAELCLQDTTGGLEAGERRSTLLLVAQDRHEDPCLGEIRRDDHPGHGDHPDPRILQLAEAFGDDGANGLVDSTHALGHPDNVDA